MKMTDQLVLIIHVITAAIPLTFFIIALDKYQAPGMKYFAYLSFCVFIFNLGYLVELSATNENGAFLGTQIKYIGVPFIGLSIFLFILDYCGKKPKKPVVYLCMALPVIHSLLGITSPWHDFYYKSFFFLANETVANLIKEPTIVYYLLYIYSFGIALAGVVVAFFAYKNGVLWRKKQLILLVIAAAIPGAASAVSIFTRDRMSFDISAIMLSLTCSVIAYLFIQQNLFKIAPIAREQIIEKMKDAFVLVDMNGHYADANNAAKSLLPQLKLISPGSKIDLIDKILGEGRNTLEVPDTAGVPRYYSISKTVISHNSKEIGICYMFFDITESKLFLDEVSEQADRDSLTGIYNRGAFFKRANPVFHKMLRVQTSSAVLMMDLDNFKILNDTYGHQTGDLVLRRFAQELSTHFREADIFARYGGEEFCAVLYNVGENKIKAIANRLCEVIRNTQWWDKQPQLSVTVSIGAAIYDPAIHKTLEDMIASADEALYKAKNTGRNRVCLSSEP